MSEDKVVYKSVVKGVQENSDGLSKCLNMRHDIHPQTACAIGSIRQGEKCLRCRSGTFSLPQWTACKEWLTCRDISRDIRTSKFLYSLGDWQYYLAEWKSYEVIYAKTSNEINFDALQELAPHSNLLYPIGFCKEKEAVVYSIDSVHLNPASQLDSVLEKADCDYWPVRFQVCLDYLKVLSHLHSSTSGPYVLCNSNNVTQVIAQFLVANDLRLIFANFDNIPQVLYGNQAIKCSRGELQGDFIAPEQHWPFSQLKVFNFDEQPSYNEKADVWKIPDITKALLLPGPHQPAVGSEQALDYLVAIHHKCKKRNPKDRPTATEVLKEYELVWRLLVQDY